MSDPNQHVKYGVNEQGERYLPLPESEMNPPLDLTQGWKPWDKTRERWWMGKQWGEAYKPIEPNLEGDAYKSIPKQVRAVRYGSDEGGHFFPGCLDRVARFMLNMEPGASVTEATIMKVLRPGRGPWDPTQGEEFSKLEMLDEKAHNAWLPLNLGDYVIQGIRGEFYPCEPAIFWASYEKI